MCYIEVEKKYSLPDAEALKAKLAELGAKPAEPTRQVDAYYNAPHRDFLAPDTILEGLRVRCEHHGASINFKRWHPVDVEIVFDHVVDAGDFVEFEFKGEAVDVQAVSAHPSRLRPLNLRRS
ncbi:CYTH domain-containing protein [Micromonospora sp. NPDC047812]|uniref:CYTH domain-containing protein n=1 Tax=Micromonospora sp. NPDC047812 TaxID=3155742 RepID=UPI003456F84E